MRTSLRAALGSRVLPLRAEESVDGLQHGPAGIYLHPFAQRRTELDGVVGHLGDVLVETRCTGTSSGAFIRQPCVPVAHSLQGRLRKRLAMALTWFQVLDNRAEVHVSEQVNGAHVRPDRIDHAANEC